MRRMITQEFNKIPNDKQNLQARYADVKDNGETEGLFNKELVNFFLCIIILNKKILNPQGYTHQWVLKAFNNRDVYFPFIKKENQELIEIIDPFQGFIKDNIRPNQLHNEISYLRQNTTPNSQYSLYIRYCKNIKAYSLKQPQFRSPWWVTTNLNEYQENNRDIYSLSKIIRGSNGIIITNIICNRKDDIINDKFFYQHSKECDSYRV